ncbi:MAG: CCA tRNA nucleotidyltransferase [Candidatus Bathyarchaeota archaeon]|nr:CCA tRNA nucleotidyltransferase [Candidatus Bathyarchaeota archaeon]
MNTPSAWSKLRKEILEKVKPKGEEAEAVETFRLSLLEEINGFLLEEGWTGKAESHGSVAHGTWISEEEDLDVFIVLDQLHSKDELPRLLETLKQRLDGEFTEGYAEHPYLQASIGGYNIDLVPCFRIEQGGMLISSTDRTPLHTEYMMEKLTDFLRDEVRLLKQFMKGVGVYGAEIKVGGFSGYLCELLIIHYGSLWKLLEEAGVWRKGEVIPVDGESDPESLRKKYNDPLIIIDPVDESRNVASALTKQSFWAFVSAAQRMIENPKSTFFFPEPINVDEEKILGMMKDRGTDIVFLVIDEHKADVPDTLWGQLHKSRLAIEKALKGNEFGVLGSSVWSDEAHRHVFVFELESVVIPPVTKRVGPPAGMSVSVEKFIEAHKGSETVSGPLLEDDRWVVLTKREYSDAKEFLAYALEDGGRNIGVSKNITIKVLQHHRILLNDDVSSYLQDGFETHLYWFLKGRPHWID